METKRDISERDENILITSIFYKPYLYTPSIDAFLLASFFDYSYSTGQMVDICAGGGIVGILIASKYPSIWSIGIEIQKSLVEMARRNIMENSFGHRMKIICMDVLTGKNCLKGEFFDVAVMNPPYRKKASGRISPHASIAIAKHELLCTFDDITKLVQYLLKHHGIIYLIHLAERVVEICETLQDQHLQPKRLRFVHSYISSKAEFVLIKAVKNGNPGVTVENPLVIYSKNNVYTEEMEEIYDTFPTQFLKY